MTILRKKSWALFLLLALGNAGSCRSIPTQSSSSAPVLAVEEDASRLLLSTERPTIRQLRRYSEAALDRLTGPISDLSGDWATLVKVLEALTLELLPNYKHHKIMIFARDGEWLYDTLEASLSQMPQGDKILDGISLINASRLIVRTSTPQQLQTFLAVNGMNIEAVLLGREKVLWLDTGNRGTIFIALLNAIIANIPAGDPARAQKIVNLITHVDGRLIASQGEDGKAAILEFLRASPTATNAQIAAALNSSYFFGEVLVAKRGELGIPEDRGARYRWVVDKMEHAHHWNGRAQKLNREGTAVASYEADALQNPAQSLVFQRTIKKYFERPDVVMMLQSVVDAVYGPVAPPPRPPDARRPPLVSVSAPAGGSSEVKDVAVFAGLTLDSKFIRTGSGRTYQILEKIPSEGEFLSYAAVDVATKRQVILTYPAADTTELKKEIRSVVSRTADYKSYSLLAAEVIDSGADYVIRERINGPDASSWLLEWESLGFPRGTPQVAKLNAFLIGTAERGIYIRELLPSGLVWNGSDWVLVKASSIETDLAKDEILRRYAEKFQRRWGRLFSEKVAAKACPILLEEVLKLVSKGG